MIGEKLNCLVIGDVHFKNDRIVEGNEFVSKITDVAIKTKPSFIVLLGDILDTHEVVKIQPHSLATILIENLSNIAPTFVLMGNHDLINHSQFLTTNHIFNPFKKWKNVFIVDKPITHVFNDSSEMEKIFVFCPYVPPGRFVEALNQGAENSWELADVIFAHQEFEGCAMSKITSSKGDKWYEDYPPVISGHIHEEQVLNDNIFYVGSSIQHSYSESPNKKVWLVDWEPHVNDTIYYENGFDVKKIKLDMKPKYLRKFTVNELLVKSKDQSFIDNLKTCHMKIKLSGSSNEFKTFRKSDVYKLISSMNVKFSYNLTENIMKDSEIERLQREDLSFRKIFKNVVTISKRQNVKDEYSYIFNNDESAVTDDDESAVTDDDESVVTDDDE